MKKSLSLLIAVGCGIAVLAAIQNPPSPLYRGVDARAYVSPPVKGDLGGFASPRKEEITPPSSGDELKPTSQLAAAVATAPTTTAQNTPADATKKVARIENPYPFAPLPFSTINQLTRGALVNILCTPNGGAVSPISGSGVVIDPRGIILTNAHVAQYVLLSENPRVNLDCVVRTGSPATPHWYAEVLYMPPIWVHEHAAQLNSSHALGTGEHDYALLLITDSIQGSLRPSSFPSLEYDTREAIGFDGDEVLAASYPAEFLGGLGTQNDLHAASSATTIKQLLTFNGNAVDAFSVGSVIEAQGGSSGGAIVNTWGRLIGVITTMSEGGTTAERDLRAISLHYVDTDIALQSGYNLKTILSGNLENLRASFNENIVPSLMKEYEPRLKMQTP